MIRFSLVVRRVEGLLESLFRSLYLPSIQNTRKGIEQYEDELDVLQLCSRAEGRGR
jgi:hypothetical protein